MSTTNGVRELDEVNTASRALAEAAGRSAAAFVGTPVDPFAGDWNLDLTRRECPDEIPARYEVEGHFVFAKAERGPGGRVRLRESKRMHYGSREDLQKRLDRYPKRMREAWGGPDGFALGLDQLSRGSGSQNSQYIPLLPGPVTRQLYWQDYFEMSAKAFEAYNHDPLTWRAVQLQQEFVLGKGIVVRWKKANGQTHDAAQAVWDEFWKRNKMNDRLSAIVRDACVLGELFLRYFPFAGQPRKLVIRSLDPATIYDIITDPEDFETVFAYHQQYQTPYQLYAPKQSTPTGGQPASPYGPSQPGQITKFVIRQILPESVDHYRLNVGNSERRGRSDLYPSLSWIQRLRHYLTTKVIRSDMLARIAWDLTVSGNASDVAQTRAKLFPNGQPPAPGTVFAHADGTSLAAVEPGREPTGSNIDPTFIALANMVCAGPGVPVDWLIQIFRGGTAANALVATEPAAKRLEDRQDWVGNVVSDMGDRVMSAAQITDASIDVSFPPIASEDETQTLQNLAFAEANMWVSKRTASARAATVLGNSEFDYDAEQTLIDAEFDDPVMEDDPTAKADPVTGIKPQRTKPGTGRRTLIIATSRQAAKLDPTKVPAQEDDPMGVLVGLPGSVPPGGGTPGPGSPGTGQPDQPEVPGRPKPAPAAPATRAGFPAARNPISAGGSQAIREDAVLEDLVGVMGELAGELRRIRETRKRPDDPEFIAAAEEYRRRSAANMGQLVRDAAEGA